MRTVTMRVLATVAWGVYFGLAQPTACQRSCVIEDRACVHTRRSPNAGSHECDNYEADDPKYPLFMLTLGRDDCEHSGDQHRSDPLPEVNLH